MEVLYVMLDFVRTIDPNAQMHFADAPELWYKVGQSLFVCRQKVHSVARPRGEVLFGALVLCQAVTETAVVYEHRALVNRASKVLVDVWVARPVVTVGTSYEQPSLLWERLVVFFLQLSVTAKQSRQRRIEGVGPRIVVGLRYRDFFVVCDRSCIDGVPDLSGELKEGEDHCTGLSARSVIPLARVVATASRLYSPETVIARIKLASVHVSSVALA